MRTSMKLLVLLFTCVLSFSISNTYEEASQYHAQELAQDGTRSYLSGGKLHKAFGLHPSSEIVVNSINSLPAPNSKKYSDEAAGSLLYYEKGFQHRAAQYLLQAETISRSLTIRDIIFPFHYFW